METVAVYSEFPVKTYGYRADLGHALMSFSCSLKDAAGALRRLAEADLAVKAPLLTGSFRKEDYLLKACLPDKKAKAFMGFMQKTGFASRGVLAPVAVIHLQGPHFGDRYGIAGLALKSLARAGAEILAVGAAVHSVCLVVAEDAAEGAVKGLGEYFSKPE